MKATLSLTHRCNIACRHCYSGRTSKPDMTLPTAQEAVDFVLDLTPQHGHLEIRFFGSEPLHAECDDFLRTTCFSQRCDLPDVMTKSEVISNQRSAGSAAVQARVEAARQRQRFEATRLLSNADMGPAKVRDYCRVDDAGKSLLRAAMQQLHTSARAYDGLLQSPLHPQSFRL